MEEIILWRAPSPNCPDPAREISIGYDSAHYPGKGVFFATRKPIADDFRRCYQNGLQSIYMPRWLFCELVEEGIIQPDGYYAEGQSWHVPPASLAIFNQAIGQGTPNEYEPETGL